MTDVEQQPPHTNGTTIGDEEEEKIRPADIEADMREMDRRKRVEAMRNCRMYREELERIVESQLKEGPGGFLQQLSDMVGIPAARVGSVFKSSNCVLPINDIRGVESMGYEKGEKILRCKMAASFRLIDLYGWAHGLDSQITARLNAENEQFLVNPHGILYHEVTASSLNKVDMQGNILEQGTTNFGVNTSQFSLHSVVHAARPDIRCAIFICCNPVVAVSSLKAGLLPLTKDAVVLGEVAVHSFTGALHEPEEREKLIRNLGPVSKVLLLQNQGALCCGDTIEEAFFAANHIVQACETQLKLLPVGLDNLQLIPEESRKSIYESSRRPPEGLERKSQDNKDRPHQTQQKWRIGGAEFEALMRMLDNAGFRTGYIYRNPLIKGDLPKPKSDVEYPPAVSSLGYLLEEEELYRQGIWKKGDIRARGDRTRWLNSPNVYQKVEVLETGTPDPKKITKWVDSHAEEWVADNSPSHSTPVKIENPLQFVPPGTNPKEFKRIQQQIKDNRRADKISAGPQSHILEGVTWDEANRIKDANVSGTGDQVVLMGAASKGIIQRGYQHNATVYKAPYAKNPFDSVTDDELNEYKKVVHNRSHGDYTDTDFSESEALSSLQISNKIKSPPSQSEPENEPQVLRIETKQAPKPSQPEVVLSDVNTNFMSMERAHAGKPPSGRAHETINHTHNFNHNQYHKPPPSSPSNNFNKNLFKSMGITRLYPSPSSVGVNKISNKLNSYPGPSTVKSPTTSTARHDQTHTIRHSSSSSSDNESSLMSLPSMSSMSNRFVQNFARNLNLFNTFGGNFSFEPFGGRMAIQPYRTVSHFGFDVPRFCHPLHFHVPAWPTPYVPVQRATSLFEIFSRDKVTGSAGPETQIRETTSRKLNFDELTIEPHVLEFNSSSSEEDKDEEEQEDDDDGEYQNFSDVNFDMDVFDDDECKAECNSYLSNILETIDNIKYNFVPVLNTIEEEESGTIVNDTRLLKSHIEQLRFDFFIKNYIDNIVVDIVNSVMARIDDVGSSFLKKITKLSYSTVSPHLGSLAKNQTVDSNICLTCPPTPVQDENDNYSKIWNRIPYIEFEKGETTADALSEALGKSPKENNNNFSKDDSIESTTIASPQFHIECSTPAFELSPHTSFECLSISDVTTPRASKIPVLKRTPLTGSSIHNSTITLRRNRNTLKSPTFASRQKMTPRKMIENRSPEIRITPKMGRRNFIRENIKRVAAASPKMKNGRPDAIFSFSPFSGERPCCKSPVGTTSPTNVSTFQKKESLTGSLGLWVAISPDPAKNSSKYTPKNVFMSNERVSTEIYQKNPDKPQNQVIVTPRMSTPPRPRSEIELGELSKTVDRCYESFERIVETKMNMTIEMNEIVVLHREMEQDLIDYHSTVQADLEEQKHRIEMLTFPMTDDED